MIAAPVKQGQFGGAADLFDRGFLPNYKPTNISWLFPMFPNQMYSSPSFGLEIPNGIE